MEAQVALLPMAMTTLFAVVWVQEQNPPLDQVVAVGDE
jgi:hypothetical protein